MAYGCFCHFRSSFWDFVLGIYGWFRYSSAVVILVFKDTILGFVASIQVSVNDMVRIGDWITFQKYGADGDVIEINLATVKCVILTIQLPQFQPMH